ncbi:MAG: sulfite exporter TauE/SafE family protein [Christensenellales bacterium]
MTWRVEGMFCPHCEQTILGALSGLPGLSNVRVSYRTSTLSADWDRALLSEKQLADILANHGYTLKAPRSPLRDALGFAGGVAALILLFFAVDRSLLGTWIAAFPTAKAGMSLGALFLVGLMTSLHCVAMCGGINVASAGNTRRSAILYNLGRVVSYTLVGAIVGALGSAFSLSTAVQAGIQLLPPPLCWPWRSICWAASVFCHRSACQAGCPACFAAVHPSSSVWLTG